MSENYLGIMMRILSPNSIPGIMTNLRNYHLVKYDDAEKLRFIGILAYPKRHQKIIESYLILHENYNQYFRF